MKKIILASKSPYRKQLLERLGIPFSCITADFDENPLKDKISDPIELTRQLSLGKAKSIQSIVDKNCIIIGSDQVCHFDGQNLGKTGSLDKSLEQLIQMQGKEHQLITSYALVCEDKFIVKTNITKLKMKKLTKNQIKNYLTADNPIDCAGSYKLELNGISLMEKIETNDHTAIIGLPLVELSNDLITFGISIPPEL